MVRVALLENFRVCFCFLMEAGQVRTTEEKESIMTFPKAPSTDWSEPYREMIFQTFLSLTPARNAI